MYNQQPDENIYITVDSQGHRHISQERPVPTKKPIIVKRKSPLYTETHIYGQKPIVIRKKSPITHKQKTLSPTKYSPSRYSKLDTSHYVNQTSPRYVKPTSPRYGRSKSPRYVKPTSPRYGRSKSPRYVKPTSPRYGKSKSSHYDKLTSPPYAKQTSPRYSSQDVEEKNEESMEKFEYDPQLAERRRRHFEQQKRLHDINPDAILVMYNMDTILLCYHH